jgi:hypothetical protein
LTSSISVSAEISSDHRGAPGVGCGFVSGVVEGVVATLEVDDALVADALVAAVVGRDPTSIFRATGKKVCSTSLGSNFGGAARGLGDFCVCFCADNAELSETAAIMADTSK